MSQSPTSAAAPEQASEKQQSSHATIDGVFTNMQPSNTQTSLEKPTICISNNNPFSEKDCLPVCNISCYCLLPRNTKK